MSLETRASIYTAVMDSCAVRVKRNSRRSDLTVILRYPLFHTYFQMFIRLEGVRADLIGWCENCPCHRDNALHNRRGRKRVRQARARVSRACFMKGKTSWVLSQGNACNAMISFPSRKTEPPCWHEFMHQQRTVGSS